MKCLMDMLKENKTSTSEIIKSNEEMMKEYQRQSITQEERFQRQEEINRSTSEALSQVLLKQAKIENLIIQIQAEKSDSNTDTESEVNTDV